MFDQVEYGENSLHFSALRYLPDTSRTLPTAMLNDFAFLPYQRMTCVAPNMTMTMTFFWRLVFLLKLDDGNPGSFFGGKDARAIVLGPFPSLDACTLSRVEVGGCKT